MTTEAFVHWNNREHRLQSELQLDADGMVVSQHINAVVTAISFRLISGALVHFQNWMTHVSVGIDQW